MLGKYNSKNDGYIKNQNIKLNEARKIILMKIAFVVVPLVLLNTFIWCVCARSWATGQASRPSCIPTCSPVTCRVQDPSCAQSKTLSSLPS